VRIHAAAYSLTPPGPFDRPLEDELYDGLAARGLAGLEQPYFGSLHRHDESWLISRLRPEWTLILTPLPGVMERFAADPAFGLASRDRDGRRRALDFMDGARRAVERLEKDLGRRAVVAVLTHSAPRPGAAAPSLESYADSLTELRRWDWRGAQLLAEHCDAWTKERPVDKGFLRLEDEAVAVRMSGGPTPAGLLINWGRSALEGRSAATPLEHLRRAREAELLRGLVFSGVTPSDPLYGEWRDSHAPFSSACPASLLTPGAAREALAAAGPGALLGVKLQAKPATLDAARRLALLDDALRSLF
jgi:hypothetical protein